MRGADGMQESLFVVAKLDNFVQPDYRLRVDRVGEADLGLAAASVSLNLSGALGKKGSSDDAPSPAASHSSVHGSMCR